MPSLPPGATGRHAAEPSGLSSVPAPEPFDDDDGFDVDGVSALDELAALNQTATVTLAGASVLLRELRCTDWPAIHDYMQRDLVHRYLSIGRPSTPIDTQRWLADVVSGARAQPRTTYILGIVQLETGRLVGTRALVITSDLDGLRDGTRHGETACIIHPDHWGRGYSTESARLVLGFAWDQVGLDTVWAQVQAGNVASERVLRKIGMTPVGNGLWRIDRTEAGRG